jgi:hypothetical protein
MSLRNPLVTLACALLLLSACGDDSAKSATDASGSDVAAKDTGGAAAPDTAPPTFNYIPLNDEACVIESAPSVVRADASSRLLALITSHKTTWGEDIELCAEAPENACAPCTGDENPFLTILRELDDALAGVNLRLPAESFEAYFREALRYQYRYLLVSEAACADLPAGSCPTGAEAHVVFAQGKRQPCADGSEGESCAHFSVENESLDLQCQSFPMEFFGTKAPGEATSYEVELYGDARDDVSFGFVVPIVHEFPPDPETISEADLNEWLEFLESRDDRVDVRVWEPKLTISRTAGGPSCAKMRGYVRREVFEGIFASARGGDLLFKAMEPSIAAKEVKGEDGEILGVPVVWHSRLLEGTFTSGVDCTPNPCTELPATTCDGAVMTGKGPIGQCAFPRPADFASGTAIDSVCDYETIGAYQVDCAAAGGACEEGACTVDWRAPAEGELVFTEVTLNPEGSDDLGEWVELTNVSDAALDLAGCAIESFGPLPEGRSLSGAGPVVVGPKQAYVLGINDDKAVNGGVDLDFEYGLSVWFDNATDWLVLSCGDVVVDRIEWEDGSIYFGAASSQLDPSKLDASSNDDPANWCASTEALGVGENTGSPGAPNHPCP